MAFRKILTRKVSADFAASSDLERRVETLGLTVLARDFTEDGVTLTLEGPEEALCEL
ncbi:DUF1949 domain-containing protein [Roseibium salinum]|nr:DUF1949 domain-containing protein [Roseibium salinum]